MPLTANCATAEFSNHARLSQSSQLSAAAPHMAAYAGRVKEMLVSRLIHVLSPAA